MEKCYFIQILMMAAVMVCPLACADESKSNTTTSSATPSTSSNCAATQTPVETFTTADAPATADIAGTDYSLSTPYGYSKSDNAARVYPLVVNGCWGEGWAFTDDVRKKYPAFVLEFQRCDSDDDGAALADVVDSAMASGLRIDANRIYLTGFSKGGSGSYKLVRGFLRKGKLFAAINRVAGQSETVLPDEAVANTSIWYHVGTNDEPVRVSVANDAYQFLKTHSLNQSAVESTATDSVASFARTTQTLSKDGMEIVKYSVYQGMGHDPTAVYADPYVFTWLFAQSLACRK